MAWRVLSTIHLTTYRGGRILAARLLKGLVKVERIDSKRDGVVVEI